MKPFCTPVLRALLVLAGITLVVGLRVAYAVEIPPIDTVAFIQTSGPNAALGNGDFYTSSAADNGPHVIQFVVPCTWPADRPITVALFDPESFASATSPAIDEVSGTADNTTFTLRRNGLTLATSTYAPTGGTDGLWVELATFLPDVDCTISTAATYTIETTTANDDEQAWRLRVNNDPDCTVSTSGPGTCSGIGAAQSTLLSDGDEIDDFDNAPGTGDELLVGLFKVSFQHAANPVNPAAPTCQTFYFQVDANATSVVLHNFDMDGRNSVTYITATGRRVVGTVSGRTLWNRGSAGSPPNRGGDVVAVQPGEGGVWRAEVCTGSGNQYIFEGETDKPIFFQQPPTPSMAVAKDDGVTQVQPNDLLTYTIVFTNTSGTSTTPGAAARVTLTDQLPSNTTYVNCVVNAPFTGTCVENGGVLDITINELVKATLGENSGRIDVTVQVNPGATGTVVNTVQLAYSDIFGNNYSPVSDSDEDIINSAAVLTATKDDSLFTDNDGNGAPSAGDILLYTITMTNTGNIPANGVVFEDTPDANTTLVNGTVTTTQGSVTSGNTPGDTTIGVDIGTVPVGAAVTMTFQVQVNNPLPAGVDRVANQGVFTGSNVSDTPTDDPATPNLPRDPTETPLTPTVAPAPPILDATKTVVTLDTRAEDPCNVLIGETLEYTVVITNDDDQSATGVLFADTPDANTQLVPASVQTTQGTVLSGNTAGDTEVRVNIGTLAAGTNVRIVYQVIVQDLAARQVVLTNQGRVQGDNVEDIFTDDPATTAVDDPTTTLACEPSTTAIELVSFTATRQGERIQVRWVTGAELNTWGFHLYRSADGTRANAVRVTPTLIPGRGRGQETTTYTWTDTAVEAGTSYSYWLQEIELDGDTIEYGPAVTTAPQVTETRVFLPLVIE